MLDSFYDLRIPEPLQEVACRHRGHIAELVSKLRSAGLDDALIERSVDQLIGSYRDELLKAVRSLQGACDG